MPDFATLLPIAVGGLALIAVLALLTWIASLVQRDASLVDRMWSLMIAGPTIAYALQTSWTSPRAIATLALVVAWGARLAAYITWRWSASCSRRSATRRWRRSRPIRRTAAR